MALLNERPAKGMRGCLLRMPGPGDNEPVLRVYEHSVEYRIAQSRKRGLGEPYDENAWFYKDYLITHYDVDIVIDDDSAAVYDTETGESVLDYTSRAMTPSPKATTKVISGNDGTNK